MSPDGKMVAFVPIVAGRRQIWIRLLAGGAPLQLTRDDADHMYPRWAPDSNTLIYFTPPATRLGGRHALGDRCAWRMAADDHHRHCVGGDISHDGQRIALLQPAEGDQLALIVASQ